MSGPETTRSARASYSRGDMPRKEGLIIHRGAKSNRPAFRISADTDGLQLTVDANFWNESITQTGESQLDFNIETVVADIRAALYYVGTVGHGH
jgi:hypothetical protein